MPTVADALLDGLASRGVRTVFGLPGNHIIALYRGLESRGIRHVTCRHEQGAAFMADGYARSAGVPGVCLLISGPGLLNAATAIAQARADSSPLLIITGVARVADLGMRRGTLHELPDQRAAAASFCIASSTLLDPANLPVLLDRAFAAFTTGRPGPVHIEIPLDLMEAPTASPDGAAPQLAPPGADDELIRAATTLLEDAAAPAIVVGGGAVGCAAAVVALAERLDALVFNTVNGKGVCPADHPLAVGGSPSLGSVRTALDASDAVLAIGTEMSETDYDLLMMGPANPHPRLIRIDIDPAQLLIPERPAYGITSDATRAVRAMLDALAARAGTGRDRNGAVRAALVRESIRRETHYHHEMQAFFDTLNRAAPDAVIVGDSTRPTYYATWQLECRRPRSYFHSVSGFGTLGFALPAAFGAALGAERAVIALIGDGGIQFTLPELTTAAELALPVAVIVWHNDGYREIENSMRARNIPTDSTRILAPDFEAAARAHHVDYAHPRSLTELERDLTHALAGDRPTLIEVRERDFLTQSSGGWYQ
ncbi:MAG: 5-guanidino-2-oxopentanoate decarboxylase [Gammaproteobacteria bacterium]|jgi:acetolactate synthase-1/2/3 large subunit